MYVLGAHLPGSSEKWRGVLGESSVKGFQKDVTIHCPQALEPALLGERGLSVKHVCDYERKR